MKTTLFFSLLFILFSCANPKYDGIFCGAEETIEKDGLTFFSNENNLFEAGRLQSSEEAFEGKYAIKVDSAFPYAFTYSFKDSKPGDAYLVTIWKKGKGGVIIASSNEGFYKVGSKLVEKKDGWEKIELQFVLPPNYNSKELKIYGFSNQKKVVYFDNFLIKTLEKNQLEYPIIGNSLNILIDTNQFNTIKRLRAEAFDKNILQSSDDSWVKAKVLYHGDTNKVKIRLKGDWLDHLQDDKWSFRIKMKEGNIMNMKEFSIQHPKTRKYMSEWLLHDVLMKEDVLTTKYDFIPVQINGRSLGVYAVEEHFKNHLLENKTRREGPMLKLAEDAFWDYQLAAREKKATTSFHYPIFKSAIVKPFSKKKTFKDSLQKAYFYKAQDILHSYKEFDIKFSKHFDVEKYAKFYALVDIFQSYHGLIWHNQRFYFNPLTEKIEPIVYDANIEGDNHFTNPNRFILADNTGEFKQVKKDEHYMSFQAFNDPVFRKTYFEELNYYINEFNWEGYFKERKEALTAKNELLKNEFPYYTFSTEYINNRIAIIKQQFAQYENKETDGEWFNFNYKAKESINVPTLSEGPINNLSLVIHKEKKKGDKRQYSLKNYFHYPITIIAAGKKKDSLINVPELVLPAFYEGDNITSKMLITDKKIKYVKFKVNGTDNTKTIKVLKWRSPSIIPKKEEDYNLGIFKNTNKDTLTLAKGNYTLSKSVIIPKGKYVKFNGANITLTNKASIISYSPIVMDGCIIIAKGGEGFSLIEPTGNSVISNTKFVNLTPNTQLQTCTGGVSIYNTTIKIEGCEFNNIKSEDGLNLVNCNYDISNTTFTGCMSDGFDIDYGSGVLSNITINNSGNDGLDVSYTNITVNNLKVNKPGDKAVSVGERSTFKGNSFDIKGAKIGIAVKDESNATIDNISLNTCDIGVVMLIKKQFFNAPKLKLTNFKQEAVTSKEIIDVRAVYHKNGTAVKGKEIIDTELFY